MRVIDEGRVRPLGASEEVEIDLRFLVSTHRDLAARVESGAFRPDLYYRIRGFEVVVPPLRERPEDLPGLIELFANEAAAERPGDGERANALQFTSGAVETMAAHRWPGNVRELKNVVLRLALTGTPEVSAEAVREAIRTRTGSDDRLFDESLLRSGSLDELQSRLEREYLAQLHADHGGDLERMAAELGIKVRALYDRFRRLKIRPKEMRR